MSKKSSKEISLSEKLSSLIHTKPSTIESDEDDPTTVAKVGQSDNEYSADELDVPKFRKINHGFLDEGDNKYSGKGISRVDLQSSIDNDFSEAEASEADEEGPSSDNDEWEHGQSGDDEEIPSESDTDLPENNASENFSKSNKKKHEDSFNREIFSKASSDIEKGKAIKNQLHIWDFFLEGRMKFEKCLVAANQFPSYKKYNEFKSKGGPEFQGALVQSKKSLKHLLHSLIKLQDCLLKRNEDFLNSTRTDKQKSESDEEIESDFEEDDDNEKGVEKIKSNSFSTKKLKKLSDFSQEISQKHETFKKYRNDTIQKWNDKTRMGYISNKNFSAFEQSTLKQIESILLDKTRLIKRTQTKRSNYHILGEDDEEPPIKKLANLEDEDKMTNSLDVKSKSVIQKEIFDDNDFFHQLLSELVKRKANDITDPVQLGKQWMQLQKIRSKMKKAVDVKASKGRKIRFVVHQKLVNFMMPVNSSVYSEDSRVELFNSLFGKNK